ncbi:MAG: hypothetical protein M3164_05170 [Actinomycetota bacterium]|nr:hypothetical protein [Actinomycetota bacterium]
MLLKWELGLDETNEAIQTGKIAEFNELLNRLTQPEAAYFCTENGRRTGYTIFDMADTSQIPVIAEPLFQQLSAKVEFIPVMNYDELQRGLTEALQS